MSGNVVYLHSRPREIAQVMRVGFSEHRRCEQLLSANKLAVRRFVIEAANFERQASLVRTLHDMQAEIVLDTNVAELSVAGRFSGSVKAAPWSANGRPLDPDDFVAGTNRSVIEPIARFAVANGVTAVMAPAHYLGNDQLYWLRTDTAACIALRRALDREGGEGIAIDYPLILTSRQLHDPVFRQQLLTELNDLPFDYLWLRIANFGADATATGISKYIEASTSFHALERPVVADHLGGMAALAACAFGAVSGFAHGTDTKERFSAGDWLKPKGSGGGRGKKKIYLPSLDRRLEVAEIRQLFDEARTSRRLFGCRDTTCCGDIDKMLGNPEAHFVVQRTRTVDTMSATPESIRTDRFIEQVRTARNEATQATKLKKVSDGTRSKIKAAGVRLERLEEVLIGLHERKGRIDFANEAQVRSADTRGTFLSRRDKPS